MSARSRLGATAALVSVIALSGARGKRGAPGAREDRIHRYVTGKNGGIAFRRWLDSSQSTGAVFTVGANGKGAQQVTRPETGIEDGSPDWSPDGSLLVFQRSGNPFAIYTVKPDGSALQRVTPADEDGSGAELPPRREARRVHARDRAVRRSSQATRGRSSIPTSS